MSDTDVSEAGLAKSLVSLLTALLRNKYARNAFWLIAVAALLFFLAPGMVSPILDRFAERVAVKVATSSAIRELADKVGRIENNTGSVGSLLQALRLEIRRMEPDFLVSFPLWFENARLTAAGSLEKEGICPTKEHMERLDRLVNALKPCAMDANVVRLTVEGHSSTASFRTAGGGTMSGTNELNLQVANARAAGVGAYLEKKSGSRFDIRVVTWQTFEQMRRPYLDDSELLSARDQEVLNRTVLIELQEAGACDVPPANRKNARASPPAGLPHTFCSTP